MLMEALLQVDECTTAKRFSMGNHVFPEKDILQADIVSKREGSYHYKSATIRLQNPADSRWDYRAEAKYEADGTSRIQGVCLKGSQEDEDIVLELFDDSWKMKQTFGRPLRFLGMSPKESIYWLPQLLDIFDHPPHIEGFEVGMEMKPYIFAVPLVGLTAREAFSLTIGDAGIVAGELDSIVNPTIAHLPEFKALAEWDPMNPKVFGVVLAENPLKADRLAWQRAQLTADIINLAVRFGGSHFEDRFDATPLSWQADKLHTQVRLTDSIFVCEAASSKGWVRFVPLTKLSGSTDWEDIQERTDFFLKRFRRILASGDVRDQQGMRTWSKREQKIINGLQRALRWYAVSSTQEDSTDKFFSAWISLEAVLNCIDYPGVLAGDRKSLGAELQVAIRKIFSNRTNTSDSVTSIDAEFFENRVRQGGWPIKTKLRMFALAFGIDVSSEDFTLVGQLGRRRAKLVHGAEGEPGVHRAELRQLHYLIERLAAAASIQAYRDIEELNNTYSLRFGDLGPEGGAAPLFINGRSVPYRAHFNETLEILAEGKVFDPSHFRD